MAIRSHRRRKNLVPDRRHTSNCVDNLRWHQTSARNRLANSFSPLVTRWFWRTATAFQPYSGCKEPAEDTPGPTAALPWPGGGRWRPSARCRGVLRPSRLRRTVSMRLPSPSSSVGSLRGRHRRPNDRLSRSAGKGAIFFQNSGECSLAGDYRYRACPMAAR